MRTWTRAVLATLLAGAADTADAMIAGLPELPDRFEAAPQRSVVVDRTGRRLATLQVENRTSVDIDQVPEHVIDAVIATLAPERRARVRAIRIEIADLPDPADLTANQPPFPPTILGLYRGVGFEVDREWRVYARPDPPE